MNFSIATLFLLLLVTTVTSAALVMESERRLEQVADENDFAFLGNYSLKMIHCSAGIAISTPEAGTSYAAIILRLCPSSSECSDDPGMGCDSGYGDYLVGINTFVKEYLENKGDEIQLSDDNFQIEELAECRQYNADEDSEYADGTYYVGPSCTSDGTGVRMALFSDESCKRLEETVTFEDISAGITLPYSDGGLVSQSCESCSSSVNGENDNSDAAVTEMCLGLYEQTYFFRCETRMEAIKHKSYWEESACDTINHLLLKKTATKSSQVGKVLGWTFFAMALIYLTAFAVAAMKNKKKKRSVMEVDTNSFVMPPID